LLAFFFLPNRCFILPQPAFDALHHPSTMPYAALLLTALTEVPALTTALQSNGANFFPPVFGIPFFTPFSFFLCFCFVFVA
jgi:hypothetical protein